MGNTIGLCDSGIGGLLVLFALHQAYPKQNLVFIADQSHVPYGDKTREQLKTYAFELLNEFQRQAIDQVVIACNTLCANVLEEVRRDYADLQLSGIIEPTANQLAGHAFRKVIVLATSKTVETHAYREAVKAVLPAAEIEEIACPLFVPCIERGGSEEELRVLVKHYVAGKQADAVIMGCTHFPLLNDLVQEELQAEIFDSNQAVVQLLKPAVREGEGRMQIYTTHDAKAMEATIERLFKQQIKVKEISL